MQSHSCEAGPRGKSFGCSGIQNCEGVLVGSHSGAVA